jgi:hypothetical protein
MARKRGRKTIESATGQATGAGLPPPPPSEDGYWGRVQQCIINHGSALSAHLSDGGEVSSLSAATQDKLRRLLKTITEYGLGKTPPATTPEISGNGYDATTEAQLLSDADDIHMTLIGSIRNPKDLLEAAQASISTLRFVLEAVGVPPPPTASA